MRIFSVAELTQEIKKQLEENLGTVAVQGEIIGLKCQSSGHFYFSLKDKDAQVSAVLFHGSAKKLSRPPKDGDQVVVLGELTVYAPKGSYQILVRDLRYKGVGELLAMLHERKNKLQQEGLFAKERKKRLPPFPKTIGVVTSPTGAVIQDIIHVLQRRHKGFHLVLFPVKVQGEGAKEEIANAIDLCNQHRLADVLIVGRGGGSLEDLWAFNEERVVYAIARSTIPVISAVGHETDISLSDFAADVRAPTPSAAAEIVLKETEQQHKHLLYIQEQLRAKTNALLLRLQKMLLMTRKNPYIASPLLLLSRKIQSLDEIKTKIDRSINLSLEKKQLSLLAIEKQKKILAPQQQIQTYQQKLLSLRKTFSVSMTMTIQRKKQELSTENRRAKLQLTFLRSLQQKKENLQSLCSHLGSINPKKLLTKGYCILFAENSDSVILSSKQVFPSQRVCVLMQDGKLAATVETVTNDPT